MPTNLAAAAALSAVLCSLPWLQQPQDPPKPAAPPAVQQPAARPSAIDASRLKELEWLCGTWVLAQGKTTIEEHWRPLQGSTMLGSSHAFSATRTQFFEYLRIAATKDGIVYVAQPQGRPPTTFAARKLDANVVEFVNAQHDHPQLIRYERTDAGVTATVSLLDGSKAQTFAFAKKP
jgi:hypothetical protein